MAKEKKKMLPVGGFGDGNGTLAGDWKKKGSKESTQALGKLFRDGQEEKGQKSTNVINSEEPHGA